MNRFTSFGLISVVAISSLVLFSFAKKNDPQKMLPKDFRDRFIFVPEMSLSLAAEFEIDFPNSQEFNSNKELTIESFYCSKYEVSNSVYREFLTALKREGRTKDLEVAMYDSTQWRTLSSQYFINQDYGWHPAFDGFPMVNISHEGAELFCKWLEETYNTLAEDGVKYKVSLPTQLQWISAAKGGRELNKYSFGSSEMIDAKGCLVANFLRLTAENIHWNVEKEMFEVVGENGDTFSTKEKIVDLKNSQSSIEAVTVCQPNNYGLYNMSGNIAEMVQEKGIACGGGWRSAGYDIRCVSTMNYDGPQTDIGFRPIIEIVQD